MELKAMIKISELMKQISNLGYPVAYHQFINTEGQPIPNPPFVIYLEEDSENFGADNKVWMKRIPYQIELYTDIRRFDIEAEIEKVFDDNNIFYETQPFHIESEQMYQMIYYITLIK